MHKILNLRIKTVRVLEAVGAALDAFNRIGVTWRLWA
jgi:hypothetical protein